MKIFVTGANGFIGRSLIESLIKKHKVKALLRSENTKLGNERFLSIVYGELENISFFEGSLSDVDVVIHCAARVHVMKDDNIDPVKLYREINVTATEKLVESAISNGVKRFIFLSTIKVNGESTGEHPFKHDDQHKPRDAYSTSKSEAEQSLIRLTTSSLMDFVIIRPPLVYGPGVKANFARLINAIIKRVPMPFKLVTKNRRSLAYVGNLVSLIDECIVNSAAGNQIFLVSDDNDISTASLIKSIAAANRVKTRLLPFPIILFRLIGIMTRKQEFISRMLGSLQVDISHTKMTLDWTPPFSLDDGLKATTAPSLKEEIK